MTQSTTKPPSTKYWLLLAPRLAQADSMRCSYLVFACLILAAMPLKAVSQVSPPSVHDAQNEISVLIEQGQAEKVKEALSRLRYQPSALDLINAIRAGTRLVYSGVGTPPTVEDPLGPAKRLSVVKELVASGADVNASSQNGRTAPVFAITQEIDSAMLDFLLSQGAKTQSVDFGYPNFAEFRSVLATVLSWKSESIVTDLLPKVVKGGATANELVGQRIPLLQELVRRPDVPFHRINWLLKNGARPDDADSEGRTALMVASSYGGAKLVSALIDGGAKPGIRDIGGATALHYGARFPNVVGILSAAGAATNAQDLLGDTPLHRAAAAVPRAEWRPDLTDDDRARIESAMRSNAALAAAELTRHGANPNLANANGVSPLHVATSVEIAKVLVSAGAQLDSRNRFDFTPLHTSLMRLPTVAEYLLSQKIDIHALTARGEGMLHFAAGNPEGKVLIPILLGRGLNVNAIAHSGRTPLHQVISPRWMHCLSDNVSVLLKHGANPYLEDVDRQSPVTLWATSVERDFEGRCLTAFLEHGVDLTRPNSKGINPRSIVEGSCRVDQSIRQRLGLPSKPSSNVPCVPSGAASLTIRR